ncbi:MAG: SH3 domain-containing protein, partial [Lachnospiraceae bacterium]|nr:SH3 domain-containing protein [Lachnospiraceae bacterium]
MTRRRNRVKILAAVLAAAMVLSLVAASITSFAATATVSGTNVNVRESASTGSSVVGTANTGDTFSVSDPVTASDGSKWYKVTLSNGNSGYIRSDLLSITEDPEPATSQAEPVATEPEPAATEPAASEKYQLVNVPDASGNDVWYVYDYEEGLRIKVEDLSQYDTIKSDADKFEKNANRYRTLLIIFAILLVALLVALALLILRLRDLMSNDVDIAEA